MRRTISIEQIAPRDNPASDYTADLDIKMRRARWFGYAIRRFDLFPLEKILDWCAREPNEVEINQGRRTRATAAILDSIQLGEFGEGDWPHIACLPRILPTDQPGNFPLRLSAGQIGWLTADGHDMIPDLWAPRGLCRRWLEARDIATPPWLAAAAESEMIVHSTGAPGRPTSRHLIEAEMKRRAVAGEMITHSLAEEARALSSWLAANHNTAPSMAPKTMQNTIRDQWRALGGRPEKK